jgi:hypothetical protein
MESRYFMLFSLSNKDLRLLLAPETGLDTLFAFTGRGGLLVAADWDGLFEKTLLDNDFQKVLILLKTLARLIKRPFSHFFFMVTPHIIFWQE